MAAEGDNHADTPAPIALFAYRRPEHLQRTLDALRLNLEAQATELFIFCDGARDEAAGDGVERVRQIARNIEGFKSLHVIERAGNYGLARSLTQGISEVLAHSDQVIVVEDDIVVSPFFLQFMNESLNYYRSNMRVGSISGYSYPVGRPMPETFFIRGADCWGWATWNDRWRYYNADGVELLAELNRRGLAHAFNFDDAMDFMQMLANQNAKKINSWAIRWHASCFLRDMLILYPGRSLAQNIGQDSTGTHAISSDSSYDVAFSPEPITVGGVSVEESDIGREAICEFYRSRTQAITANPAAKANRLKNGLHGLFCRLRRWMSF